MADPLPANPLMLSADGPEPAACSLVIFGGVGDLSRRKLIPAVYNLALDGVLPTHFLVVGVSRDDRGDEAFRQTAHENTERYSRQPVTADRWADFEKSLYFVSASLDDPTALGALRARLDELEPKHGIPGNRVFYLAVPPNLIEPSIVALGRAGLIRPVNEPPFSRVIVEKPIGTSLATARQLENSLAAVFDERQIFRIDHYLGKETVQNIMVLRFANSIFEPLWNQKYIDHVQITVSEEEGVGTRAGYYDQAGALRDMVQNHILQLLCLTAMEPPWSMQPEVVRDHKLEVLRCLRGFSASDVRQRVVRAQYTAGFHHGADVPGYQAEAKVPYGSTTETYVAIKVLVDNWRWSGVPFYLRTGKRLPKRASEIAIAFKDVPEVLFNVNRDQPLASNVLALRIQPDEGLSLRISTKRPGARVRIYPVKMDFRYGATFGDQSPEAYERLLLDVMAGDPSLFMRRDGVEASWAWIDQIIDAWNASGETELPGYAAGTWGPAEADALLAADGRSWRTL